MYVGVDVTHPAPGSMAPSIAAVAMSLDSKCTIFSTVIIQNEHRVELVSKIGQAILRGVREFQKKNQNKSPARILVFRDGMLFFFIISLTLQVYHLGSSVKYWM